MPMDLYIPNHRLFNLDFIHLQEAMIWYHKDNSKKSYNAILESKRLRADNPQLYFKDLNGTINNIIICCLGAKQYSTALEYTEQIKEFQIANNSIETDIPYFVYQMVCYIGLYPVKYPNPAQLIQWTEDFLLNQNEEATWMYEAVGSFCLLYGFYDKSKFFLEHPPLITFNQNRLVSLSALDLLHLVIVNDQEGINDFINQIARQKQQIKSKPDIVHLDSLKKMTSHF